jgi:purine-binding chemotaxis protein CheW
MSGAASQRAADLRVDFDRGFADAPQADTAQLHDLLVIQAGAQTCAVRLSEVAGIFAGKTIIPVPGSEPTLKGIAGFRGAILPVYDLGLMIGQPGAASPRWLAVAAASPIAFAFDRFERQLRIPASEFIAAGAQGGHMGEFVRSDVFSGPVLNLQSLLDAITSAPLQQEHRLS